MSAEYEGKDPLDIAKQAERDINSYENKTGNRASAGDSSESPRPLPSSSMPATFALRLVTC